VKSELELEVMEKWIFIIVKIKNILNIYSQDPLTLTSLTQNITNTSQ
jgi:hypothetical protein